MNGTSGKRLRTNICLYIRSSKPHAFCVNLTHFVPSSRTRIFSQSHAIDLFTDSDAIFEKSIPQCIMGYPGYMCIRREVNKL